MAVNDDICIIIGIFQSNNDDLWRVLLQRSLILVSFESKYNILKHRLSKITCIRIKYDYNQFSSTWMEYIYTESYHDRFYNLRDDNRTQLARNIIYENEQ